MIQETAIPKGDNMKTVVITGSSSGFGKMSVKQFADKGHKVYAAMRNADSKNLEVKNELQSYSENIVVVEMDVCSDESVNAAIAQIMLKESAIDVLINNAGIMHMGVTEAFSVEQAQQLMNTNFYGVIRTVQAVAPHMRNAGKGLIINTTSVIGRVSWPFTGTYSASKAAVEAYSQSLKFELAPSGVEVVIVEPGPSGTNLAGSFQPEAHTQVVAENPHLKEIIDNMSGSFDQVLQDPKTDPQKVVDGYLTLVNMEHGTRPTRTAIGLVNNVDKINDFFQPLQDQVISDFQLDFMLETKVNA
ncbi:2-(R)-hydroxypropyl-CoM dehydrogenase [Shewanella sp. P1-14-1]|uniref:SDR family oxidoreductase n=1 Tax=Shewanella sp. P1-14-1 TaxID=1723761 RepID=UPI0006D67ECC|nr:SDR family oxidoreductase [Shewanella sp. P1-14-1]KPZ71272.1 2-(R)-hydroxypropyl-CoM dehydrogenase [Shewanella sp. P1-14-1]